MNTSTDVPRPRHYWHGISDEQLREARAEYLRYRGEFAWCQPSADEIEDELLRRAYWRRVRQQI